MFLSETPDSSVAFISHKLLSQIQASMIQEGTFHTARYWQLQALWKLLYRRPYTFAKASMLLPSLLNFGIDQASPQIVLLKFCVLIYLGNGKSEFQVSPGLFKLVAQVSIDIHSFENFNSPEMIKIDATDFFFIFKQ